MSKEVAENDMDKLKKTISFSLRSVFTIMIPSTIGLMILSDDIIRILFQRGNFTAYSTNITSLALFYYSVGLMAYGGIKILVGTYYSMGDTRTPVKTAAVSLAVNLIMNLILMWPLKVGGLALATSIAATLNFVILYIILIRRIGDIGTSSILKFLFKIAVSGIIMGFFTYMLSGFFLVPDKFSTIIEVLFLILIIIISMAVFFITTHFSGVKEVNKLVTLLKEKLNKKIK